MSDAVLIGLMAATPPTILATAALVQTLKTHKIINSRMDEMLRRVEVASFAAGQKSEKDANELKPK